MSAHAYMNVLVTIQCPSLIFTKKCSKSKIQANAVRVLPSTTTTGPLAAGRGRVGRKGGGGREGGGGGGGRGVGTGRGEGKGRGEWRKGEGTGGGREGEEKQGRQGGGRNVDSRGGGRRGGVGGGGRGGARVTRQDQFDEKGKEEEEEEEEESSFWDRCVNRWFNAVHTSMDEHFQSQIKMNVHIASHYIL